MKNRSWLNRFGSKLIGLPVAIIIVVFAVSNRQAVTLTFWPLPGDVTMPVYLLSGMVLLVGFALGGIISWIGGGQQRQRVRAAETKARSLGRELALIDTDQRPQAQRNADKS